MNAIAIWRLGHAGAPGGGTKLASITASAATSGFRGATALSWVILVALLLMPLTYGNPIGIVSMLAALVAPIFLRDGSAYRQALELPHVRLLVLAFVALAIAILAVSRSSHEALIVFDFVPFLLALPATALFLRAPIRNAASKISLLAFGGTVIGFLVAAFQHFVLHAPRPGGWELSPIHFGDLAVILGFMSLGALGSWRSPWRWLCWAGPLVGIGAGVLSGTRGSLIVAVVLLPLAAWYLWSVYRPRLSTVFAICAALVVLAAAILGVAAAFHVARALDVISILGDLLSGRRVIDETAAVRLDQYQAAIRAFFDAPLFGHGWRNEIQSALQYMSPATQRAYANEHWGYVHNDFLSFSVGMGIFGSIAWVLLFAYPPVALLATQAYPDRARRSYLTLVAWLGILVSGLSDVFFKTELTRSFYCFVPCAIVVLCRGDAGSDDRTSRSADARGNSDG